MKIYSMCEMQGETSKQINR